MRLAGRLVLAIAVASIPPLGILGLGATQLSTGLVTEQMVLGQSKSADALAVYVETWMALHQSLLGQQVAAWDVGVFSDAEQRGFLALVAQQIPEARVVALIRDGRLVGSPLVRTSAEGGEVAALLTQVASEPAQGFGRAHPATASNGAWVPLTVATRDGSVLAVALDLEPIARQLGRQAEAERQLAVVDDGRVVLGSPSDLVLPEAFASFAKSGTHAEEVRYTVHGVDVLAACQPVPSAGWVVVVAEPLERTALAARAITARTAFLAAWGVLLAGALGVVLSRQLTEPVIRLKDAALAVAEGAVGRQVDEPRRDEIGDLAEAFNFMSRRLAANRDEIDEKNKEIEKFNEELQQRVEERTRELAEAQERLVRSARLAAAGEMGAGLAHELNNPLAGILGMVQVVLAQRPDGADAPMLRAIEDQARRCTAIVADLLRLSGQAGEPATRGHVALDRVLHEAVRIVQASYQARGVTLELDVTRPCATRGDDGELLRALSQLLSSVRAACAPGSRVLARTARHDGEAHVEVRLVEGELSVGGDEWKVAGLGFWASRRAIVAHGGEVDEPDGAELAWRVRLPAADRDGAES